MITEKEYKEISYSLRDFCNIYLIDLVDNGFIFDITYDIRYYNINLTIWKLKKGSPCKFRWFDIKDNFLPFYEMLNHHYKLDYQIINKQPKHIEFSQNRYFHNSEINDNIKISTTDYIKISISSKI